MKHFLIILVIAELAASCKKENEKKAPFISITVNARTVGDAPFILKPLSNSGGEFSFPAATPMWPP